MHVTFEQAQEAIAAALVKAKSLGTQMCIAVVDSGAELKAFARMDDAWVGSVDIAVKKAKTACFFAMPTGQMIVSPFFAKPEMDPSDFRSKKLATLYCLRLPAFVLRPPRFRTPLRCALQQGLPQMT